MLTRVVLAIAFASSTAFAHADLYSCIAPDGRSVLQAEPCRNKPAVEHPGAHAQPNPPGAELNVPKMARSKCLEAGYDPQRDAEFATCMDDLRRTMYTRFCEQAGRIATRLDACVHDLHRHDEQYGKQVQLDYYCIARDKAFGTPQYKACTEGAK